MGELLGLGLTHYPPLAWPDEHMADLLGATLADPALPPALQDPGGWPEALRTEYADDRGAEAAAGHRKALRDNLALVRQSLDEFRPDVVLVWGDDQYELFREECVPAMCVLAFDDQVVKPWGSDRHPPNVWDEDPATAFRISGAPEVAKALTASLISDEFDIAYAYRPRSPGGYPHAFLNTVLYLDYDRQGFDYPVLPISINCYGQYVIKRHGGMGPLSDIGAAGTDLDPPAPTPARCMALGAAVARFVRLSDLRVAVIASSSWSHAFMTDKTWHLHPDHEADRGLFEALRRSDYATWRAVTPERVADAGQQELLNWFCLMGAMEETGSELDHCELVETHAFNSNKCFAVYRPQTLTT